MTDAGLRKRLVAILAADAAGYSRLMATNELGTVALLDAARAVFKARIEANQGRVIDMAGDSVLAVFETATGAVVAALEIQDELGSPTPTAPAGDCMRFRIGVHVGDVIEKSDGTVYGDGVNIAARLQTLAEPGSIAVSDVVHAAVGDRVSATFTDAGQQQVKNIAKPIRAFRATQQAAARKPPVERAWSEAGSPRKPSVAVLPFDNLSGNAAEEYFADGITEDVITLLSKNRWLSVIARNSTFAYKGRSSDVRRVAQELGAVYVVEGSVRRASQRLRVTAQLIDGSTGTHLWAERYDRDLEDIFALQDELTTTIAGRIEPELGAVERERVTRKPTENLTAWDCYHLGLFHMYRFDREGNQAAQRLFRRAMEHDPNFAAAHARLAYCVVLEMVYFDAPPSDERLEEALSYAKKAVLLDDKDAFSHLAVARVHLARREYEDAIALCKASIELNPTFAQAYCALGDALCYGGREEEAMRQFEESIRLSPHDPWRWAFYSYEAMACIFLARYDKAVELAQAALRIPNCQYWANAHLAAALGLLKKTEEARVAVEELRRCKPEFSCRYAEEHLFWIENRAQLQRYVEGLQSAGVPAY